MKYDITAIGNALVDTQFKVSHEFIAEVGLEIDQMNLSSAEEHAPIIDKLKKENAESVSDCGGSATNTLVAATHFGAKCFHTCVVADDEDGHSYLANLKNIGVHHNFKMRDADEVPTGKCLILVTADAKRTMSTALNVSALMQMNDIDFEASIIGRGNLKKKLQNYIDVHDLRKSVRIYDYIENPYPIIKQSNLFILTSKFEGLPNVLLESLVLKKFIISSNCHTGPKEILLNGKGGLLFKVGDYEELAKKIKFYCKNKKKCEKLLIKAYKSLYRFDFNKNLKEYLKVLRSQI